MISTGLPPVLPRAVVTQEAPQGPTAEGQGTVHTKVLNRARMHTAGTVVASVMVSLEEHKKKQRKEALKKAAKKRALKKNGQEKVSSPKKLT